MRYRRSNPLNPYAYDQEAHPFVAGTTPTSADHIGVHTTPEKALAVAYAVIRASQGEVGAPGYGALTSKSLEWKPGNVENNCGVILTLDTTGLEQLPDVDAAIRARYDASIDELLNEPVVVAALAENDEDTLADAVVEAAEQIEHFPDDDVEWGQWQQAIFTLATQGLGILQTLADLNPTDLLRELKTYQKTKTLSGILWAHIVLQYRYMVPIGIDRLLKVTAIRPVNPYLEVEEGPFDDEPQIMSSEWLDYADDLIPDTVVLWEASPQRRKVAERVEYHGTDIGRARVAFPEIAASIKSPWPYTQPVF